MQWMDLIRRKLKKVEYFCWFVTQPVIKYQSFASARFYFCLLLLCCCLVSLIPITSAAGSFLHLSHVPLNEKRQSRQ